VNADTRRAAVAAADRAHDADDLRLLLAMLGLAEPKPNRQGGRGRPPVDHGHGHYRTYAKGCRCAACRKANSEQWAQQVAERSQDPSAADRAGHGKPSTYKNYGCRCTACRAANTADVNAYRARRRERTALAETGGAR
jgi:hypothetical protein